MQNPGRAFRSFSQPRTPSQRFTSVAIVAAIHVAAITALVLGLNIKVEKIIPSVIDATVIAHPKVDLPIPPKLPVVTLTHPTPPTAPIPQIDIAPKGDTVITVVPEHPYQQLASTNVSGIMNTHSIPPYPPISRRLSHEGMVVLKLMISPEGVITAVQVESSSGYAELDDTAAQWVKTHWRYRPAMLMGQPVASMAEASVRFSLKDAR